jgi:NAD(P)-dependent dehydrogenase (short-subunit alcohol dehydrogenase family)
MNALVGQTVVVIGGSSGIGPETARRARHEGHRSSSWHAMRIASTFDIDGGQQLT